MRRDQISLQLYTVRGETARDMPGTLRKVSEIGYPAVEFAGYGGLTPQEVKTILDDLGLRTSTSTSPSTHGRETLKQSSPTCTPLSVPTPSCRRPRPSTVAMKRP
ncbi:MAG: hypothetical protein H0U55_09060 [Rubrobacteraceae bacterium]|nr:hypothetical protein [Rubrobacteraceae bacterium]